MPRCAAAARLAVVLSPHLTVEEAYLMATYARQVQPAAALIPGPVPTRGEDQSFAGRVHHPGREMSESSRCRARDRRAGRPVGHLGRTGWNSRPEHKTYDAVWIAGGYTTDWNDATTAAKLEGTKLLIVQDLFASPLGERADWQLPATAFAERSGSFVNRQDRLQTFEWAIRPPRGVMSEGQLFWRLLGRHGLYNAPQVLRGGGRGDRLLLGRAWIRSRPWVWI